jgi:hypothetical protein
MGVRGVELSVSPPSLNTPLPLCLYETLLCVKFARNVSGAYSRFAGLLIWVVMVGMNLVVRIWEGSVVTVTELICRMRGHVAPLWSTGWQTARYYLPPNVKQWWTKHGAWKKVRPMVMFMYHCILRFYKFTSSRCIYKVIEKSRNPFLTHVLFIKK